MSSIRKTKTSSGATAVQVVRYENRKVVIMKHLGSAKDTAEIATLIQDAEAWINRETVQPSLFSSKPGRTLCLASCRSAGVRYVFAHTMLSAIACRLGLSELKNQFLVDFILIRILEPASKLRSIKLLEQYFGIKYSERSVYRLLPKILKFKPLIENLAVNFAKEKLTDDLSFVLYDVTTLYFESFEADELRQPGFSKDNKANQPQIVVGLLVNKQGFPLGFEVFQGNTFEGKTMLPVLEAFRSTHNSTTCTVVADAAMMGIKNIEELNKRGLNYIVGARAANLSPVVIEKATASLGQKDGATVRFDTDHGDLICSFSAKRWRKDNAEMEKQITKAKRFVDKKESGRRAKFVTNDKKKTSYVLNDALVEKTTKLLGVKGYYTNIKETKLTDREIIARYHDLWHVEQAFRMAKGDLATRPIFHYKKDAVKAHLVICFAALMIGKYLEIETGLSLRNVVDILKDVIDSRIVNIKTGEEFSLPPEIGVEAQGLLKKLGLSY